MANNNLNIILLIPFLSTFMITLNIYNGDLNKIISGKKLLRENTEYMLWFLIPFLYYITAYKPYQHPFVFGVLILGILSNLYWNKSYPWTNDSDRIMLGVKDHQWTNKKTIDEIYTINNPRHRTEYYGTQFVLCSMLFTLIVNKNLT